MADPTPTRTEEVAANLEAVETKYGAENWYFIWTQLLTDINKSLAMLVDAGSSSSD